MATKYFLKDTNAETTCDVSGATNQDISTTQGTGTTVDSPSFSTETYFDALAFDIDVSGDNPANGNHDISIDVNAATDIDYRFRVEQINDAGPCSVSNFTDWSTDPTTGTGIKTLSATSLTWGTGDRLRLIIQAKRQSGTHGNKTLTINVNDADSYINAPWDPPPVYEQVAVQIYNDDASTSSADDMTSVAAANVECGVESPDKFWVRFLIECSSGSGTLGASVQFRINGGSWTNLTTSSSNIQVVSSGTTTDGTATTSRMGGTGTFVAGSLETSSGNAADISLSSGQKTEFAVCCQWNSPTQKDLLEFRAIGVDDETTALDTYTELGKLYADCLAMAFQDGVTPTTSYTGTLDTFIRESNASSNVGGTADPILVDGEQVATFQEDRGLVKWDISDITGTVTVLQVDLTFEFINASSDQYEIVELTGAFTETSTWNDVNGNFGTIPHSAAGILGLTPASVTGLQTITLDSDGNSVVEDWINGVSTNHGFGILDDGSNTTDGIELSARNHGNATDRPKLLVLYESVASGGPVLRNPIENFRHNLVR